MEQQQQENSFVFQILGTDDQSYHEEGGSFQETTASRKVVFEDKMGFRSLFLMDHHKYHQTLRVVTEHHL